MFMSTASGKIWINAIAKKTPPAKQFIKLRSSVFPLQYFEYAGSKPVYWMHIIMKIKAIFKDKSESTIFNFKI